MNTPVATPVEQRICKALRIYDSELIRAVRAVMLDELFMTTVDDLDPVIFDLGVEHASAIVYGRILRPYVAAELTSDKKRLLRPDGAFAEVAERPARYASEAEALRAAESAGNRLPGGVVVILKMHYLPIA